MLQRASNTKKFRMLVAGVSLLVVSCSTISRQNRDPEHYIDYLQDHTYWVKSYSGLVTNFEMAVTPISNRAADLILQKKAMVYEWPASKIQQERDEDQQQRAFEYEMFVSFFSNSRELINLADADSLWKIFLDQDGKRYEAKLVRATEKFPELNNRFPHFTRWAKGFWMKFAVPTHIAEQSSAVLTITGPVDSRQLVIPKQN
ncbi:MAG: hypothetical protein COT74_06930 [Bdellovibrionales bacterium CG10_big_fil_rev_8_21_14_0_10_45_34]|nr:MAG: hypothetical protein COT74_06930 [Bdellovibrionales bacterium CG10_big_fil_rev_8_21_14_0_10_45_34]